MAKVLFVNGPASGHVYPTVGLVEELAALGEEVTYVSSHEFRSQLERLNVAFVAYDNFLSRDNPFDTQLYMSFVLKILKSYEVILPIVMELAERHSFDYFIHDSMYGCGTAIADLLGIPHIAACTSFIHAERFTNKSDKEANRLQENLLLLKRFRVLAAGIERKFGLKRRIEIHNVFFNEGNINLVFTSEQFQPFGGTLDGRFKFIGPCLTNRFDSAANCQTEERDRDKRTIYISMGTVYNDVRSLYELCCEALSSFDGRVIMSVGNQVDLNALEGKIPPHFTVVRFAPQLEILQRSDLFITHGGMNSVNEALYYHVPLIVVPMAADQPMVGERVAELGAGIMLDRHTMTADRLRDAVEEILQTPEYAVHSARIGDGLRAAGGQKKAIEEIRRFKEAHNIKR
ncbi:macrolide family glycosyltransferase [Paenibacillus sp. MSJ-34]|uniref:macrolide family glycosyltransferase n=1 Tax=Paenibacillus sp. MSJ-34 TaxID=2841529 RepID=UPI001C11929D|nr:macrolide family glycosyltransferase [Paenibacillus sp. MSJ-34]MBU5440414.1 hypothetical protein [Paenibacillus sp. MSJ-34]